MIGDGCTGFQWAEWFWSIRACCDVHDMGGSDGTLLDCLFQNMPTWAWAPAAFCVAIMVFLRPIYRLLKGWHGS